MTGALDTLAADPRQPLCEQVAAQLTELGSVLTAHMDEEENTILPLAAEYLSAAEWEELGEISLAKLDKKHLLRAFSAWMAPWMFTRNSSSPRGRPAAQRAAG